jgi:hypothetical protein
MIQAAARGMIESKVENGSIVSFGSISGKVSDMFKIVLKPHGDEQ